MNSSYDEKKRKKSCIAISDFFLRLLPIALNRDVLKPQNLPQDFPETQSATIQFYRTPTDVFRIAAISRAFRGRLSA
jgi:hypothetical protein